MASIAQRTGHSRARSSVYPAIAIAIGLASAAWAPAALASFEGRRANGTTVRGEFAVLDAGLRKAQSSLFVGATEIPRVRPYCFEGFGGYRCPHRLNGLSAEVYPRLDSDGELRLHVIFSDASGSESVTLNPVPAPS